MPLDITPFLPLAAQIARSFSNIPGLDFREIDLCAQEALAAAARKFDPTKGDFAPYAAQAVRNALCGLYEKQLRHHQHHAYTLNQAAGFSTETDLLQRTPDTKQDSVNTQVGRSESVAALQRCLAGLPPKQQKILQAIGQGRSYVEIGADLGVTKQAAYKSAATAIQALREALAREGFSGLDSVGLLKSSMN